MNFDLAAVLPLIIPKAIAWAEQRATEIATFGTALTEQGLVLARQAAVQTGLLGPNMIGLTLGHSIYICHGHDSPRLLSHECRHVQQYEEAGSIAAYLPMYLQQIAQFGYSNAPYEIDARAHESVAQFK